VYAILHCRGARNTERLREIVRQSFHNDGVAAQWKMRPMLLGGADRYDERGSQE
jgi:hypothetical protein